MLYPVPQGLGLHVAHTGAAPLQVARRRRGRVVRLRRLRSSPHLSDLDRRVTRARAWHGYERPRAGTKLLPQGHGPPHHPPVLRPP